MKRWVGLMAIAGMLAAPAFGQQTGSISGTVVAGDGGGVGGVSVTATSPVLPQSRSTTTSANGDYRLPLLVPGTYTVTFAADGMATESRTVQVLLQQNTVADVGMAPEAIQETVEVIGASLVDLNSTELKASIGEQVIQSLPIGQEYRDLVKLIPGVQFTQDTVRGPSAGGSGQDNAYQFDGVNVTLPLFGTLSSQPSSHDIEQVSVVKGGAKAIDFNRSGGFSINSVSKSGTSAFHGQLSYQVQSKDMVDDVKVVTATQSEEDKDWLTASLGGPIIQDRLFFFLSAYAPTVEGTDRSNQRNPLPPLESNRDEYFGKVTFAPTSTILLNGSFRTSETDEKGRGATGAFDAASTTSGNDSNQDIAIVEGSWVISDRSFASFKYTDYALETASNPDTLFGFSPALDGSVRLDVNNLDQQGLFVVPTPISNPVFNAFIIPIIQRYGTVNAAGVRIGGGNVGGASTIDGNDFFRQSYQAAYDLNLGRHDLHFGIQRTLDEEDLDRFSNGWGVITVGGGVSNVNGVPIAYTAQVLQTGLVNVSGQEIPIIHSEFESTALEVNDNFKIGDWAFNAGLLVTNDVFYGQGLREKSGTASGFELARGNKYKMYEVGFEDMIQPRLGAIWAYDGANTVYTSYARYMPAASSLPRAASWDRNLAGTVNVDFDATGRVIRVAAERGSSGKLFSDGLDPRTVDEYVVGTSRQLTPRLTARAHTRYRYGYNYWEDTNNDARTRFGPPASVPQDLYIPNLTAINAEIRGGSYVIAELDGAFSKYLEAGLEAEWRGTASYVRASYVWSHYYGNFDQDNSTTANDANVFIGSSNIADDPGRQLWNNRYGDLRGDRRHQLKVYGFHDLPWNASVGAYTVYQSGQPWEVWDVEAYRALLTSLGNTSTSSTARLAEPAGSRTTDAHYQLDLNYTQNIAIGGPFEVQLRADVFNVLDKQTGYNIQNQCRDWVNNPANCPVDFGKPRDAFDPRRLQVAVKLLF